MGLEKWKSIDGFSHYEISSWGRVYSLSKGIYINPEQTSKGYLRVRLINNDGVKKNVKVHRLVALAFIDNPNSKPQVNHIDGNKQNNSITNLEWVTNDENCFKAKELRRWSK